MISICIVVCVWSYDANHFQEMATVKYFDNKSGRVESQLTVDSSILWRIWVSASQFMVRQTMYFWQKICGQKEEFRKGTEVVFPKRNRHTCCRVSIKSSVPVLKNAENKGTKKYKLKAHPNDQPRNHHNLGSGNCHRLWLSLLQGSGWPWFWVWSLDS